MNFIKDHFEEYDASKFQDAWETVSYPQMLIFQIGFWIYSYYFMPIEKDSSILWNILNALYYGFGGILLYIVSNVLTIIFAFILDRKRPGFIMLVVGIIGAILAFIRLNK